MIELTNQTSSAGQGSAVLTTVQTNLTTVITLSGVGRIHGQVLETPC